MEKQTMKIETLIKKIESGIFKMDSDIKVGNNVVEYQKPNGSWDKKVIVINKIYNY